MSNAKPLVVVVENDFSLLKAIERLLMAFDYETETYTSAELYLQRDNEKRVDCLVLDINLDGMSGLELQKKLIIQNSAPPIIFITGRGDARTFTQATELGCVAFLRKPFESQALRFALNTALGSH